MEFNPTDRFIQILNTQEIEQLLQIAENNPSQINIDQISQTLSTCFTNSAEQSVPSQKTHSITSMASTNGLVKTVRNQESFTTKHEKNSLNTQLHRINLHYKIHPKLTKPQ